MYWLVIFIRIVREKCRGRKRLINEYERSNYVISFVFGLFFLISAPKRDREGTKRERETRDARARETKRKRKRDERQRRDRSSFFVSFLLSLLLLILLTLLSAFVVIFFGLNVCIVFTWHSIKVKLFELSASNHRLVSFSSFHSSLKRFDNLLFSSLLFPSSDLRWTSSSVGESSVQSNVDRLVRRRFYLSMY